MAQQLISENRIDPELIQRMVSYFAHHEIDKRVPKFGNEDNPSAGYIAWLLWGGDAGRSWSEYLKKQFPTKKRIIL